MAIFALLTGYVCALKPLKLARNGKHSDALSAIAKSAFRRPPRLILPQVIAMLIAWTICQLHGFQAASRSDSDWLRYSSPVPEQSLWWEVGRFFSNFISVWSTGDMDYDDHQWALVRFLKGSMIVFVVCSGLIYTKFRFRMVAYLAYLTYWWLDTLPETGQYFSVSFVLCPLSESTKHKLMASAFPFPIPLSLTFPYRNIRSTDDLRHASSRPRAPPLLPALPLQPHQTLHLRLDPSHPARLVPDILP